MGWLQKINSAIKQVDPVHRAVSKVVEPALKSVGNALTPAKGGVLGKATKTTRNFVHASRIAARHPVSFATGGLIGGKSGIVELPVITNSTRRTSERGNSLRGGLSNPTVRYGAIAVATYVGATELYGAVGAGGVASAGSAAGTIAEQEAAKIAAGVALSKLHGSKTENAPGLPSKADVARGASPPNNVALAAATVAALLLSL